MRKQEKQRWATALAAVLLLLPAPAVLASSGFDSRERLVRTLARTANDAVTEAEAALRDARQDLRRALAEGAPEEEIQRLEMRVERRENALETAQSERDEELQRLKRAVNALSDDQVFAFNRSLNNTLHNGLEPEIGSEGVIEALRGDYDKRQINALTKAFEEEDKFLQKAEALRAQVDDSDGLSREERELLRDAERLEARAEAQRDKFLAKIDRFDSRVPGDVRRAAKDDARGQARAAARKEARLSARQAARDAASDSARDAARSSARDEARQAAKQTARAAAKENGRGKALGHEKSK
jgi:hypothetical protein